MVNAMREDRSLGCSELSRYSSCCQACASNSLYLRLQRRLWTSIQLTLLVLICRWLTMAQITASSFGEKSLSMDNWEMVKELERLRKQRMQWEDISLAHEFVNPTCGGSLLLSVYMKTCICTTVSSYGCHWQLYYQVWCVFLSNLLSWFKHWMDHIKHLVCYTLHFLCIFLEVNCTCLI